MQLEFALKRATTDTSAFIAEAARRTAETKRTYFTRYLADSALNED